MYEEIVNDIWIIEFACGPNIALLIKMGFHTIAEASE